MSGSTPLFVRLACSAAVACAFAGTASAETLKIGLASEPTAVDPHYHQQTANDTLGNHIFETLVGMDAGMKLYPLLAESWKAVDDSTWEFKLREGVKFSNGAPFGPDDVIFTLCRVLNNETAISGGSSNIAKRIASISVEGNTLRMKTVMPYPVLANELARVPMLSASIVKHDKLFYDPAKGCGVDKATWPTVNDFNSGKAAIGTGPYTLKAYVKGGNIDLVRNDAYWGKKPEWTAVQMTTVPANGPRLTGLLSGTFDLIENPAARDIKRITDSGYGHVITPSIRVVFWQPDVARAPSPGVKSPKGPADNPLRDVRVRRAISMAIDRKAIVARIMDGVATPANQYLPDGMFGALAKAPELKYDPAQAKKLLAEAGYPDGFELTLSSTNDRYINDAQITQAVAQYLTRVGIKANVDTMTRSVYFPKRAKLDFSFSMGGWGQETGEASNFIQYWVTTRNNDLGLGTSNYGGYSNAELDKVFKEAIVTVDDKRRAELLNDTIRIAIDQMAAIPLHFESSVWAFRKGLAYEGRADQKTLAMSTTSVKK